MPPGMLQFMHGQLIEGVPIPEADLTNRTFIVTGANSGLGLECVKHLIRLNAARVVMGCRNTTKGEDAKSLALAAPTSPGHKTELLVWPINLSRFASVTDFVSRCTDELDRLDGVVANAGVAPQHYEEAEGFEQTLTVNVLSTFLLAKSLLPKLKESARKYSILPRLSIVGSMVQFMADTKEIKQIPRGHLFETLTSNGTEGDPAKKTDWSQRYFLSKLFVAMGVRELADHIKESSDKDGEPLVVVNDVHPGYCRTALFRDISSIGETISLKLIGRSSEEGSRTLVHGVLADEDSHGKYMGEGRVKPGSPFLQTEDGKRIQKELWNEMMQKLQAAKPGIADI